jgi:hypothetical protein
VDRQIQQFVYDPEKIAASIVVAAHQSSFELRYERPGNCLPACCLAFNKRAVLPSSIGYLAAESVATDGSVAETFVSSSGPVVSTAVADSFDISPAMGDFHRSEDVCNSTISITAALRLRKRAACWRIVSEIDTSRSSRVRTPSLFSFYLWVPNMTKSHRSFAPVGIGVG